jgi:hypothetical protein
MPTTAPRAIVLALAALSLATLALLGAPPAGAQVFGPPMTLFGSITDSEGPVAEGLPVEAYVGNTLCGRGVTEPTGDGDGRVIVYAVHVVAREQTAGCGSLDAVVRVKIGDRFATQTATWEAGPKQLDITFGSATPAPIPTFTPTPTRTPSPTPNASQLTPTPQGTANGTAPAGSPTPDTGGMTTPRPAGTIPAGSPGAGSPFPTTPGGVVTSPSGGGGGSQGGGGFPVWAAVVLVLGGIALVGGGVGFAMAKSRTSGADEEADEPPLPTDETDELR